ncbi:MAG: hypothetical protein H7Y88_05850 [Phycisphaerales bacterium]|nr:hypothetical protein [Phycisphaerales bacterium]
MSVLPLLGGCESSPAASPGESAHGPEVNLPAAIRPRIGVAHVFDGQPLIVPVYVQGRVEGVSVSAGSITLDAKLHALSPTPTAEAPGVDPDGAWLGASPSLRAAQPGEDPVAWFIVAQVPVDIRDSSLRIGDHSVPLVMHAPAPPLPSLRPPVRGLAIRAMQQSKHLLAALQRAQLDPALRWRAQSLSVALEIPPPSDVISPTDSSGVLDAAALHHQSLWSAALNRLSILDAALATDVHWRLVSVVSFGHGIYMPVWPAPDEAMTRMLETLLDAGAPDEQALTMARAWVESLPDAAAWIIDDAGWIALAQPTRSTPGEPSLSPSAPGVPDLAQSVNEFQPIAAVVNFLEGRVIAWAHAAGDVGPPAEPLPVESFSSQTVKAGPMADSSRRSLGGPPMLQIRVGGTSITRPAIATSLAAAPPGLLIGPLHADLTGWAIAAGANAPPMASPLGTKALLYRNTASGEAHTGAPDESSAPTGWTLYVECATAPRRGESETTEVRDQVRIWIGPSNAPRALRVGPNGAVFEEGVRESRFGERQYAPPKLIGTARAHIQADRWSAWVSIPASAIEAGPSLRLGIDRVDGLGRHSAWPRPMLPWQIGPGRVIVDLSTWTLPGEHLGTTESTGR